MPFAVYETDTRIIVSAPSTQALANSQAAASPKLSAWTGDVPGAVPGLRLSTSGVAETPPAPTAAEERAAILASAAAHAERLIGMMTPAWYVGPGNPPEGLHVEASPTANVVVDTPASPRGNEWSAWTPLATLDAITEEQAGVLDLRAHGHAILTATPGANALSGGGDRVHHEERFVLVRSGQTDEHIVPSNAYGPRNVANAAGTAVAYIAASRVADFNLGASCPAIEGDVLRVETRLISQQEHRRRLTWDAAQTYISISRPGAAPVEGSAQQRYGHLWMRIVGGLAAIRAAGNAAWTPAQMRGLLAAYTHLMPLDARLLWAWMREHDFPAWKTAFGASKARRACLGANQDSTAGAPPSANADLSPTKWDGTSKTTAATFERSNGPSDYAAL